MRKKVIKIILLIFLLLLLCVLFLLVLVKMMDDLTFSSKYRDAERIQERLEDGQTYTKDDIFKKFGTPHDYYDDTEHYSRYYIYKGDPNLGNREGRYTQEEYDDMAYRKDVTSWHYSIYRYSDGSDPHSISIKFNEDGKVVSFKMERMGGG